MTLSIGQLSEHSGVKVPTIRYYEKIGVIPEAPRNTGNQRRYGPEHLQRLRFIRHARDLGFDMDSIRAMVDMTQSPQDSCDAVDSIAKSHLAAVRERIAQLTLLEQELERMVDECKNGRVSDCRVIQVLGDHGECATDHGRIETALPKTGTSS